MNAEQKQLPVSKYTSLEKGSKNLVMGCKESEGMDVSIAVALETGESSFHGFLCRWKQSNRLQNLACARQTEFGDVVEIGKHVGPKPSIVGILVGQESSDL